jgi:hypothetical protein
MVANPSVGSTRQSAGFFDGDCVFRIDIKSISGLRAIPEAEELFISKPMLSAFGDMARSLHRTSPLFISSDSNGPAVFPYPMIRPLFFALSFFALLIPCLLFYAFAGVRLMSTRVSRRLLMR